MWTIAGQNLAELDGAESFQQLICAIDLFRCLCHDSLLQKILQWCNLCDFSGNSLDDTGYFLLYLQGMSEEAVRQTRSQKRALERDAAPQSVEPFNAENESKKPKLDPSEPTEQAQTNPKSSPVQDGQNRTSTGSEPEQEQEQDQLPLSFALPLASQAVKDDQEQTQRQQTVESSSDNWAEGIDKASKARAESGMDTRSRGRQSEEKSPTGILAAGEVKATIKVEVQTGEQPVDMSTSRG